MEDIIERITREVLEELRRSGIISGCTGTECDGCTSLGGCVSKCNGKVDSIVAAGADRVGATLGVRGVREDIAGLIDHTLLKPDATRQDIRKLCEEAMTFRFCSVCVNPYWVRFCSDMLSHTNVRVCTVVGFPFGATTTQTKIKETETAIADGAREIDMVINIGALKSGDLDFVEKDIAGVVRKAGHNVIVKTILETAYLTNEEKVTACRLAVKAGADFVKTSTGFGPGGATVEDIVLMRSVVGPRVGVKASGGIRDVETAIKMVKAGATRIGASASVRIVGGGETASATARKEKY